MTRRTGAALVLMFLWTAGVAPTAMAGPPQPEAGAAPFKLGAFRLVALHDANNNVPNDGKTFGVDAGPPAVAKVLAEAHAPTGSIAVSFNALVVKMPGHIVLLDTGLGPKVHGALPASLARAGIAPSDLTDVLITHSHPDHVGGLATADGRSAFPHAVIRMSTLEWTSMQKNPGAQALVAIIRSQVRSFEPGGEILPGIRTIASYGHTPGHSLYEIVSGRDRLIDIGDTAHSSIVSLAKPDWTIDYDGDAAVAKSRRRAVLANLAKTHELVFAPHFPFPGVGRIVAAGDGFAWQQGVP